MKMKKFIIAGTMALVMTLGLGAVYVSAAQTTKTPAQIVADLTNKTIDEIIAEHFDSNKTYGTIAAEAGVLEEFKALNLEEKIKFFNDLVADGKMTKEKADAIIAALKANAETCDGTGSAQIGKNNGAGFGQGQGQGKGLGKGQGQGLGRGQGGQGQGLGRGYNAGTCTVR